LGAKESSPFSADVPLSATRTLTERGPSGAVSAPLFYVPFLIMAKEVAVRQKTAKQLFSAIKKTDGAPYGRRRFLFLLQIISFS